MCLGAAAEASRADPALPERAATDEPDAPGPTGEGRRRPGGRGQGGGRSPAGSAAPAPADHAADTAGTAPVRAGLGAHAFRSAAR